MRLLVVGHDCCEAGAQHSLLRILRWLRVNTGWRMGMLALGDGPLAPEYAKLAPLLVLPGVPSDPAAAGQGDLARVTALTGGPPDLIFGNTAVSARAYGLLAAFGAPVVTRIAELDDSMARYVDAPTRELLLRRSDAFVAVSGHVAEMLTARLGVDPARVTVINGAVERTDSVLDADRRAELLVGLGIAPGARLLWGCGSVSRRKGADLFLGVAEALLGLGVDDFHALWAGYPVDDLAVPLFLAKERSPARSRVTFLGQAPEPELLMAPGDVFLMTSREDPFPLVCLEAAERGLPSLCFPGCGGIESFVRDGGGLVAQGREPADMAQLALPLLADPRRAEHLGRQARALVLARHSMASAGPRFAALFERLAVRTSPSLAHSASSRQLCDDLTIVVRGVGERTAEACSNLLRRAVPGVDLVEVRATPFSEALRQGFAAGIERGRRWTLVMDADVLVRADFPREVVDFAEAQGEDLFVVQGLVLDKMFGLLRPAGNHLYRTAMLPEALERIPEEGATLRPESATIDGMTSRGRLFIQTPLVAGLHDYCQHPLDIVRKCFVQAHKHGPYVDRVWPFWEAAAEVDQDFVWAMLGARLGRAHAGQVFIDSGFLRGQMEAELARRGGEDLPELDVAAVHEGFVQAELLASETDARRAVMQQFMFPPERWSFVYGRPEGGRG
jgi:glycosyltransferase involved in cell wall biosynthesis